MRPVEARSRNPLRIAEIYRSKQGEGLLTGTESVFVRASGCNLRCRFCDTPYASWRPEGDDLAVNEIVARVERLGAEHVVITGGEPMLFAELIPLCERLRQLELHITIETAGTLYLPVVCDLMSISPKLANSTPGDDAGTWVRRHEETRIEWEVLRRLTRDYAFQLKFVIDDPADCEEVEAIVSRLPDCRRDGVWLMPQGRTLPELRRTEAWLKPLCEQTGFRYCPRRQIEWYGPVRGT